MHLEDAAIIRRDRNGKLHVIYADPSCRGLGNAQRVLPGIPDRHDLPVPARPLVGAAAGLVGAAIVGAGDSASRTTSARVQDLVQPGTSAIMAIVRKVTPDKLLEAVAHYNGTVLQTSLPRGRGAGAHEGPCGSDPVARTWEQHGASASASA